MFLNLFLTLQVAPRTKTKPQRAHKSAKEAPNVVELETKRLDCTYKMKVDCANR